MSPFRALFPFLVLAALARADVVLPPPPGQARVRVLLDLGPFAGHVSTEYRVRRGDTLGAIAEEQLGSAKRLAEILALNPGIDGKALRIGQEVLLPPRADPKEAGLPWIDFMDRIGPTHLRWFPSGTFVRGTLYAVPHERLEQWRKDPLRPLEGVATGTPPSGGMVEVDPASRVERVERLYRLKRIAGARMEWDLVEERRFDGEGKRVGTPGAPAARNGGPADLLFGCLAAAGFVGLSFALSRRLRARTA